MHRVASQDSPHRSITSPQAIATLCFIAIGLASGDAEAKPEAVAEADAEAEGATTKHGFYGYGGLYNHGHVSYGHGYGGYGGYGLSYGHNHYNNYPYYGGYTGHYHYGKRSADAEATAEAEADPEAEKDAGDEISMSFIDVDEIERCLRALRA